MNDLDYQINSIIDEIEQLKLLVMNLEAQIKAINEKERLNK